MIKFYFHEQEEKRKSETRGRRVNMAVECLALPYVPLKLGKFEHKEFEIERKRKNRTYLSYDWVA